MASQFVTRNELNRLMKNFDKKLKAISVRESIKAPSPEQAQSEEFMDEQYAGRNSRDADYTDAGIVRWGTFIYKDIPKMNIDMRILAFITCVWNIDVACHVYFRLRNGASGYDQAGTVRWNSRDEEPTTHDYNPMFGCAFFDIPAGSTGNDAKICCDVKRTNAAATVTVIGDTNLEGADTGGCELRIISAGRY